MNEKRVRTVDEIIFEQADPQVVLAKGSVYAVEAVLEQGERFMIDLNTFELGFEAAL